MAVVIIAALLVMGVMGYRLLWGHSGSDRPNLMCVTPDCGYGLQRRLRVGEVLPLRCPRCGERSVYGTHPCGDCGTPVVLNRQRGVDEPTHCPGCGAEVHRVH